MGLLMMAIVQIRLIVIVPLIKAIVKMALVLFLQMIHAHRHLPERFLGLHVQ